MTEQQSAAVEHHEDEGHSVLGWVCVVIMLIGVFVGSFALFFDQMLFVWIGTGLTALGAIAWPILKLAGVGRKAH